MKELTIDKFNENNAVFVNGKRVSDDARFPLCIENETYQNEIREHFYKTLNANMERMKNITTSVGCGWFHQFRGAVTPLSSLKRFRSFLRNPPSCLVLLGSLVRASSCTCRLPCPARL